MIHGIGIVIGNDVRIGKNVTIYQGVTLGGNSGKTQELNGVVFSQPWISDNVCLFANSMVIGPVFIGENSRVGAGAVVMKNVEADTVVYTKHDLVIK